MRRPKLWPYQVEKMQELYEAGMSLAKLARKFDRSEPTIRRYLKGVGVTFRSKGRPKDAATEPKQQLPQPEPDIPDPPVVEVTLVERLPKKTIWKYKTK